MKLSFFEYNYPLIKSPIINKDFNILISSDEDIAAMKAIAIIFFKSLTFFEDAEKSNIKEIDVYWEEIKDYFKKLVKGFYLSHT